MGNVDVSLTNMAYPLKQTGAEIQRILNAVDELSDERVQELLDIVAEIKAYDGDDDDESVAAQLTNIFNNAVMENEVRKQVDNNVTYPPTSKAVMDALTNHANGTSYKHANGSIKAEQLANNSVTTSKIYNGSVTTDKLGNGSVTAAKLMDNAVTTAKLGDNSVTTSKISDGSVTEDKINKNTKEKIDKITSIETLVNKGGKWHYGTDVKHTENAVKVSVTNAKSGDFYYNTQLHHVYYTDNGENWYHIGNLKGSINESVWAKLDSPKFTGEPKAPTPESTNNSKQIATTEFVHKAIQDSKAGGEVLNNGYREISGQVLFNNVPDVRQDTPEILSQKLTIISEDDATSVSISATGSVKWQGITYNATADTTFDATANHGSLDESFTNVYIKYNKAAPSQSSIVFSYDAFSVVTDEYIIIPIERVEAKYSMITNNEGWFITGHTPIGYEDVPIDTLVLKSQLDKAISQIEALESTVNLTRTELHNNGYLS